MMRSLAAALIIGTALASPAWALSDPKAIPAPDHDPHIQVVTYGESQVTAVHMVAGNSTGIEVSKGEKIAEAILSDSAHLKKLLAGNTMFLKATLAMPPQPVFIKTVKLDGSGERLYSFVVDVSDPTSIGHTQQGRALLAAAGVQSDDQPPADQRPYLIRFTYPEDQAKEAAEKKAAAARRWAETRDRQDAKLAAAQLHNRGAVVINEGYTAQGDSSIAPDAAWDDGQSTFFRYNGNRRLPALFGINPDGKEATITYSVVDGLITVHETAERFRMRDGDLVLCISNPHYYAPGYKTDTDTNSPTVQRRWKKVSP